MKLKALKKESREVGMGIKLSALSNSMLTRSAQRSSRSKSKECLLRIEDHLKRFPVADLVPCALEIGDKIEVESVIFKSLILTVKISAAINHMLTKSIEHTKMSKSLEASTRLEGHLKLFESIASVGEVTHHHQPFGEI